MGKGKSFLLLVGHLLLTTAAWSGVNSIHEIDSIRKTDPILSLQLTKEKLSRSDVNTEEKAELFYTQGKINFTDLGDKENAIASFYNALKHFRLLGNSTREYAALTYLALSYQALYHYEYAIDYYDEILTKTEPLDSLSMMKTYYNLGSVYRLKEDYVKAHQYLEACIDFFKQRGLVKNRRNASLELALVYLDAENFKESKKYYHQVFQMSEETQDSVFIARCLNSIGYINFLEGDTIAAKIRLLKGLEYKKASNDQRTNITSYLNLGELYKSTNQWQKALSMFQEASELNSKYADNRKIIEALEILAEYHEERLNFQLSTKYKNKIISLAKPYIQSSARLKILHSRYQAERMYEQNANMQLRTSLALERQRTIIFALAGIVLLIGVLWLWQHYRRLRRVDDDLIIYLKRHGRLLMRLGNRYELNIDDMLKQIEQEEKARQ